MAGFRLVLVAAVIAVVMCIAEGRPQTGDDGLPIRRYSQADRRHGFEGIQLQTSQPIRPFVQASDVREIPQNLPVRHFSSQREPEDLPVRPFDQYENSRGSSISSSRVVPPPPSQPVKPFSQAEHSREHVARHTPSREKVMHEEDLNQSRAHVSPLNPRITLQSEHDRQQHRTQHHTTLAAQRRDETPHWSTGQVRLDSGSTGGQQPSSAILHRDNRRTNPQDQTSKGGSKGQQGSSSVRMGAQDEQQGKSDGAQEGIIFPGPTKEGSKVPPGRFAPQVSPVGPNCAKGSTFCESTDGYPSEYLKTVLKKEGDGLMEFFGNDLLLNDTSISQRIDSIDENPLCQSVEQVVYPKMAQNKEDKWLYVVNQDQYIQGVRVEKCLKPESECLLSKSFPLGYKTICRQKYIYRRLVALNDEGKAHSDTFRLPSCCSCFVKSVSGTERKR